MNKTRFNIALSPALDEEIDKLASEGAITKTEVIRKALALFLAAKEAEKNQGLKIGFYNPTTRTIETEIVNL